MGKLGRHLRARLLAGILVALPLAVTYFVLAWLFRLADGLLQPVLELIIGRTIPGVGLLGALFIVYLLGFVGTNLLSRRLLHGLEAAIRRTPMVNTVYIATKHVLEAVRLSRETPLKRVVLVEYPRKGMWTVAFSTGSVMDVAGERMQPVYIPTTPTPFSGFMILLPEAEVKSTTLSVEEALRMVISGGFDSPTSISYPT